MARKTNTDTLERHTVPKIEQLTTGDWQEAASIVNYFTQEPDFARILEQHNVDPTDTTTIDYAHALSKHAEDYLAARRQDELIPKSTQEQVLILANTPYFLHVQQQLNYYENERKRRDLTEAEHDLYATQLKPYAIWYNQMTSDFIYTHPETRVPDYNSSLIYVSLPFFAEQEQEAVAHINSTTRGARTEAVSRMLLDEAGVTYRTGSANDDMRGGDVLIEHQGKLVKVDLKSSPKPIARVLGADFDDYPEGQVAYAVEYDHRDKGAASIMLYAGFTDEDLGDNCHLDAETSAVKAKTLAIQIQNALENIRN